MTTLHRSLARWMPALTALLACAAAAGEFSVTPIRAELKPGQMSETITVVNHATQRLRVNIKLMEWTQDATGKDVYQESADLIYFPRQMDIEADGKRLVRVGARAPGGVVERAYRLYIEEEPEASRAPGSNPQVALRFRFGVPVFLPPAVAKPVPEVMEPELTKGRVSVAVKNPGNAHFRLNKVTVSDGATYSQEVVFAGGSAAQLFRRHPARGLPQGRHAQHHPGGRRPAVRP